LLQLHKQFIPCTVHKVTTAYGIHSKIRHCVFNVQSKLTSSSVYYTESNRNKKLNYYRQTTPRFVSLNFR